jgi:serine/threonine-protein kinase
MSDEKGENETAVDAAPDTVVSGATDDLTVDTLATGQTDEQTVYTVVTAENEKTYAGTPSAISVAASAAASGTEDSTPGSGLSTTLSTAEDALNFEEVKRTRAMIRFGWIASVIAIGLVPAFGGHPVLQGACIGALLFGIVTSIGFYRRLHDPANLTPRWIFWISIMCAFNAQICLLYFGNLSAATAIFVMGLYFLARTGQTKSADKAYVFAATLHAIPSLLMIFGIIGDYAVYATDPPLTTKELIVGELFVQTIYFFAYFSARQQRKASLESIDELQEATRLALQREALLQELRQDLDRALKVGGPGRYTDRVLGSYRMGVVIGRGAMGEVYESSHVDTGEVVAVKLLHRELLADQKHVTRFLREARAASALDSPFVAKVITASEPEDPIPFLVMERLTGITLSELLRRKQRLAIEEVIELVVQIGSVIDSAKERGIVHRDLKPGNIRLAVSSGPRIWKVLDFGVSTLHDSGGTLTQGAIVGTPAYISPEQASSEKVDHRADLYALAAIAYRCLVGRPPYSGKDLPSLLYQAIHEMPRRPGELAAVPRSVEHVLAIGLAKNRDDRFDSGWEFCAALRSAASGELTEKLTNRARTILADLPWRSEG